ncbi:MAG: copper chaperone PCu(A)C [Rickettsiales bacterium]|nr:copper chaperone PCu(A)C [Rickettsiales bacterium]
MRWLVYTFSFVLVLVGVLPALAAGTHPLDRQHRQQINRLFGVAERDLQRLQGIKISDGWMYATRVEHRASAGFITISNYQEQDDALIGASSPLAEKIQLQLHTKAGDILRVREIQSFVIPKGAMIRFSPGAEQLLFMQIHQPLDAGMRVPVTLRFRNAGAIQTELVVKDMM